MLATDEMGVQWWRFPGQKGNSGLAQKLGPVNLVGWIHDRTAAYTDYP